MFTIKTDINQFKTKTSKKGKKYKVLLNAGGGCFGYIITYHRFRWSLTSMFDQSCQPAYHAFQSLLGKRRE